MTDYTGMTCGVCGRDGARVLSDGKDVVALCEPCREPVKRRWATGSDGLCAIVADEKQKFWNTAGKA